MDKKCIWYSGRDTANVIDIYNFKQQNKVTPMLYIHFKHKKDAEKLGLYHET